MILFFLMKFYKDNLFIIEITKFQKIKFIRLSDPSFVKETKEVELSERS